jgi:hypothetical protein
VASRAARIAPATSVSKPLHTTSQINGTSTLRRKDLFATVSVCRPSGDGGLFSGLFMGRFEPAIPAIPLSSHVLAATRQPTYAIHLSVTLYQIGWLDFQ